MERSRLLKSNASSSYNLRSLDLKASDVIAIANILKSENQKGNGYVTSISFSFNHDLGDLGAEALSKSLPNSLTEIGLVGCEIGDKGGLHILEGIKKMPHLNMICIENNKFSEALKNEFRTYSNSKPHMLIVV